MNHFPVPKKIFFKKLKIQYSLRKKIRSSFLKKLSNTGEKSRPIQDGMETLDGVSHTRDLFI